MKRLIIIGAGPHYCKKYDPILQDKEIALVVDLKDEESRIRNFFGTRAKRYLFLNKEYRNSITLEEIRRLIGPVNADGALICTEPKVHAQYALWATEKKLPIFLDKPGTITLSDFVALLEKKPRAVISCERRAHPGYQKVFSLITEFTKKYNIPITSIDIHFAGGKWQTPTEYTEDENHPYKYGYGMLMHSGYHYVDLLARLLRFSDGTKTNLQTLHATPKDHIYGSGLNENLLLAAKPLTSPPFSLDSYGEIDLMVMGQKRQGNRVCTNFSLKMFGTSLSTRTSLQRDEYVPGKTRQEIVLLHFGHLMSIQIASTQYNRIDPIQHPEEQFTITIMRNPLLREKNLEVITRPELSQDPTSLNTKARQMQLLDFIQGKSSSSPIEDHLETMNYIDQITTSMHRESLGRPTQNLTHPGHMHVKEDTRAVYAP